MLLAWFDALSFLMSPSEWVHHPFFFATALFTIWMGVDALRRQDWLWAIFILIGFGFSALLYFFLVYRVAGPAGGGGGLSGFELPGAGNRRRIKELQGRIHHLDHARDHLDLADVYFSQGKLKPAEASYRESLKRDPSDVDAVAHLGQCLLRQGRHAEARPMLEQVLTNDPTHDYGHTQMALAEVQTALGDQTGALASWAKVLERNNYARARVQYGELLATLGQRDRARQELKEAIADDAHVPTFQKRRDQVWIRRAKRALAAL